MKKYFANMSVNNGTYYRSCFEGTNYKKLTSQISNLARANCFVGNQYNWWVWDEKNIVVAAGSGIKKANGNFSFLDCRDLIGDIKDETEAPPD